MTAHREALKAAAVALAKLYAEGVEYAPPYRDGDDLSGFTIYARAAVAAFLRVEWRDEVRMSPRWHVLDEMLIALEDKR